MFGLSGRNIPRVRSYSDALKVFDNAYRHNRFKEWRGLSSTRDTTKTVKKDGPMVVFRYHTTDVVRWLPDRVSVTCVDTRSTVTFAHCLTPMGVNPATHHKAMYVGNDQGCFYPRGSSVEFVLENARWVVNPNTVESWDVEHLNKQRAARIRQILKPFLDWKESVERLQGSRIATTGTTKAIVIESLKHFIAKGKIPEDTYMHLATHGAGNDAEFMAQCYVLGGAVSKIPATFGSLKKKSKYRSLNAWAFL